MEPITMIPGHQKRRGNPDAFGATPPAAPARIAPVRSRYRLLLTRLPGRWELIIFDRECTRVMRRLEGPVVDGLRETRALPPTLLAEGACDADKSLVQHIFLAAASLANILESPAPHSPAKAASTVGLPGLAAAFG
ncbi:MAG: hypothetical protein P8080_03850 [Gammaproteobacteria bacterium]